MPHGSSSGDDFASTDEVKIYKEEGEEENKSSAENLSEEKIGLLTETEQGKGPTHPSATNCFSIADCQIGFGSCLADYYSFHSRIPFGYHTLLNPYSYAAGSAISGLNNVPTILPPSPWFYMCSNNHCAQGPQHSHVGLPPPPPPPPPAPPQLHISSRTGYSPSSPMYHLPGAPPSHQLSHLFVSRDFSPISCFDQFSRNNHGPYPLPFGSPYLPSMMPSSSLTRLNAGDYFSSQPPHQPPPPPPPHHHRHHHHHHHSHPPPLNIPCAGVSHPTLVCPYPAENERRKSSESAEGSNSRQVVWFPLGRSSENSKPKSSSAEKSASSTQSSSDSKMSSRRMHIKKPLNAFMLFMKEMRSTVVDECTLKESAAINQILGRKWHSLSQSEQNKYYEMARKEKLLHRQKFPGWSARDNYATQIRKKRKREQMNQLNRRMMSRDEDRETSTSKKCRARYGLDQQHRWCKPCRRKKRCIRFLDDDDAVGTEDFHEDSSNQMPTADSTVNESHLFINMPSSSMTSSALDTDCVVSEPGAPRSSRSLSTPGHGHHVPCEDFPMTFQCYPKKTLVSSWSDGASSSIGSPSQHMTVSSAMRPNESNRKILSSSLHSTS